MLRIIERGSISFGIPKTAHAGEANDENSSRAPDFDKSSIAVTNASKAGKISRAHCNPLAPPFTNASHIFTFLNKAKTMINITNAGTKYDVMLKM